MIRPKMKSSVFCLGLAIALACPVNADPQCHTSEIMQCLDIFFDYLHSLPKGAIPATDPQIDTLCQEIGKEVDCELKYKDSCMTPLQKEIIGLALEGTLDFRKDFCSSPGYELRTRFLSHAACLNKASQSDAVKEQVLLMLSAVENLPKQEHKNKIMYFCCGYSKFYNEVLKIGIGICGEDAMNTFLDGIHMFTAQLLEVVCNNVNGTEDSCQALLPPAGSKPSDDAESTEFYKFMKKGFGNWID